MSKPGSHAETGVAEFMAEAERPLTWEERALVEELMRRVSPHAAPEVARLRVVGRCACGDCPTVFFRTREGAANERQLSACTGVDDEGGMTGVALWEARGHLTKLDFWSVDGHAPWSAPSIATLKKL